MDSLKILYKLQWWDIGLVYEPLIGWVLHGLFEFSPGCVELLLARFAFLESNFFCVDYVVCWHFLIECEGHVAVSSLYFITLIASNISVNDAMVCVTVYQVNIRILTCWVCLSCGEIEIAQVLPFFIKFWCRVQVTLLLLLHS